MGPLQGRLQNCMNAVLAKPFATDASEWTQLQVYLKWRPAGWHWKRLPCAPKQMDRDQDRGASSDTRTRPLSMRTGQTRTDSQAGPKVASPVRRLKRP